AIEFISCLVAATMGVIGLCLARFTPWEQFAESWWTFWLGDLLGVLVVASLIISWSYRPLPAWNSARIVEGFILVGSLLLLGSIMFGGWFFPGLTQFPVAYLFLSFLVWSAVRFGIHGVTGALVVMACLAIGSTIGGVGPFFHQTVNESLLTLQAFIGVMTL